jgi:hypothetical protein
MNLVLWLVPEILAIQVTETGKTAAQGKSG